MFLDTSVFIYYLEDHPVYATRVEERLNDAIEEGITLVTSVITLMEFSVQPNKLGKAGLIRDFHFLLKSLGILLQDIDIEIAGIAGFLRAKYPSLKSMDGLQIATAIHSDCRFFLTNDKRLSSITEIGIQLLSD
ncbi:MAG: PIN domain-containing protein [Bacteroidota bacterium]